MSKIKINSNKSFGIVFSVVFFLCKVSKKQKITARPPPRPPSTEKKSLDREKERKNEHKLTKIFTFASLIT